MTINIVGKITQLTIIDAVKIIITHNFFDEKGNGLDNLSSPGIEYVVMVVGAKKFAVHFVPVLTGRHRWMDIDTIEDLDTANQMFADRSEFCTSMD